MQSGAIEIARHAKQLVQSAPALTQQGSHIARDITMYAPGAVDKGGREWGGQLLYSYKVNLCTAFYGGVSYGAVRDDDDLAPNMFGNSRGVSLKYSYGWQPGG